MVFHPFGLDRDEAGLVLLCLVLSAICIYIPCRWNYRPIRSFTDVATRRYLPYLYLVFYCTLPIQAFKNYRYYEYARGHGGYVLMYLNHGGLASSVPFFVRAISLITFPVFVAIFVFERNKRLLYIISALYFATAALVLLLGPRMGIFGLAITLWYVARVKNSKKTRIVALALIALLAIVAADLFQNLRDDPRSISKYAFVPGQFLTLNFNSFDVTAVAVKYRHELGRYVYSYLLYELADAFVSPDVHAYFPGRRLSFDVTVLLNPIAFDQGYGTAGSYVAEAYLIGGVGTLIAISLLIGAGLHVLHLLSRNALSLFVVAMVLPDVLSMPRGQLLDWVSVLVRNGISVGLLVVGWKFYQVFAWSKPSMRDQNPSLAD
jgi:hypothetical protein